MYVYRLHKVQCELSEQIYHKRDCLKVLCHDIFVTPLEVWPSGVMVPVVNCTACFSLIKLHMLYPLPLLRKYFAYFVHEPDRPVNLQENLPCLLVQPNKPRSAKLGVIQVR